MKIIFKKIFAAAICFAFLMIFSCVAFPLAASAHGKFFFADNENLSENFDDNSQINTELCADCEKFPCECNFVCEINGTKFLTLAAALNAHKDGETIKILRNTEHTSQIKINDKEIIFDLNGFDVKFSFVDDVALYMTDASFITIGDGKFEMTGGILVFNSTVFITADINDFVSGPIGAHMYSAVTVNGNVTSRDGIVLNNDSKVTINGTFNASETEYIDFRVDNAWVTRTRDEFDTPTTKAGYFTYFNEGCGSTLWVKDFSFEDCEEIPLTGVPSIIFYVLAMFAFAGISAALWAFVFRDNSA